MKVCYAGDFTAKYSVSSESDRLGKRGLGVGV